MNWKYYRPKFEYEEKFLDLDWPWAGHKNFAYDLIRNMKPETVVELGTHKGTSFFSFCQAAKDEKLKTKLYAVDTWKGDKHAGFYDESIYKEVAEIVDAYYKDSNIHLLKKTFDEAVNDFENKSIDILHIDGLHTYEAVKHDFENWFSKVKDSGVVIFHDTAERSRDFGVYKLWEELKSKYKAIDFFHSHGLGMMFKGKNNLQNITIFKEIWQQYYPLLNENRLLSINLERCETDKSGHFGKLLEEKKETISNLIIANQQKDQVIQQKEFEVQEKELVIQQNDSDIQQKDQIIRKKDAEIHEKDQAIQQKEKILKDKNAEIKVMKSSKFWKLREKYLKLKNIFSGRKNGK